MIQRPNWCPFRVQVLNPSFNFFFSKKHVYCICVYKQGNVIPLSSFLDGGVCKFLCKPSVHMGEVWLQASKIYNHFYYHYLLPFTMANGCERTRVWISPLLRAQQTYFFYCKSSTIWKLNCFYKLYGCTTNFEGCTPDRLAPVVSPFSANQLLAPLVSC